MMNRKTTKPLKIFLLGARSSIHLVKWANGLSDLGHNVILASHHQGGDPLNSDVQYIKLPFRGAKGYLLNVTALKKALKKHKPDLLHIHYATGYGLLGTLSGYRPRMVSVWGSDIYNFPQQSLLHKKIVFKVLSSAQLIGSTSQAMADEVIKTYPILRHKLRVTPFGVDPNQFRLMKEQTAVANTFVIGTVKALSPNYGIDILIKGYAHFKKELQSRGSTIKTQLLIAGDGPQKGELVSLCHKLNIENEVEFRGWVSHQDVPKIINEMDVFVAMSHSESFGVAVVEASACAKPVIVSRSGGLPEVVEHGKTGFVLEDSSPENLSSCLLKLTEDNELAQQMGGEGRQRVLRRYSWDKSLGVMQNAYHQTLKRT
jgi:L-malate glycosyltransferase